MGGRRAVLSPSPLRLAAFRALWIAATVSFVGSFVQDVGERWIILELTKSPLPSAMLSTTFVTASLLAMLPAGVLADRVDRRTLVVASQLVQGTAAAVVAVLTFTGRLSPALLLATEAVMGIGMALGTPAWNALMPEMVPREQVAEAIALNAIAFNIARAIGPAIGGIVLSSIGATASFALNAASFVAVVIAIRAYRPATPPPRAPPSPLASALGEPLRIAARDAGIRATILAMVVFTAGASMVYALMPAYGKTTLGATAREYGLMFGAMGLGAIGGTWLLRPIRRRVTPRVIVACTITLYAATAIALSRVHDVRLAMLLFLPAGAGWTGTFSSLSTLVQMWAPDRLRARVVAVYIVGHFTLWAIGSTIGGMIAERASVRMSMAIGACICAFAALVVARLPIPRSFVGRAETPLPVDVELEGPISTRAP
ncbi:MAG TPA: MFS transporter [Labilithrix sp.]